MPDNLNRQSQDTSGASAREPNWERAALERIALSAINEQRAARRWKIFFRFAFLAALVVLAWGVIDFSGDKVAAGGRHTALIRLDGEVAADTDANAGEGNPAPNNHLRGARPAGGSPH